MQMACAASRGIVDGEDARFVELAVSDYSQIGALADYVRLAVPGAPVTRNPGKTGQGELGTLDVLTVVADSGVLIAVVNALPTFLRSRKPGVSITVKTVKGNQLTLTANNVDEVIPVLDRFLDG
jgi:hypothetical protein